LHQTHAFQISAANDELAVQHQRELRAQREESAKLKDQLFQARSEHAKELQQAISVGQAQAEANQKQFAEAEERLRQELEEERKQLREQKEHLESVQVYLTSIEAMVKDTDAKALSKLFSPCL
jgi:flagellar motility protein MotE (MotC chaperone)